MKSYFSDVQFRDSAGKDDLIQLLTDYQEVKPKAVLVLLASESDVSLCEIPELARMYDFPIYALVCAGVIYSNQYSYTGMLVLSFSVPVKVSVMEDLDLGRKHVEQALDNYISSNDDFGTSIVFIDGMSRHVEAFVRTLYEQLGDQCNFLGAGAGHKSLKSLPCIADQNGCYGNAALILSVINGRNLPSIGAHGWTEIAGPLLITSADKNRVMELNYKPAFEEYKKAIEEYCDIEVSPENFQHISNSFPFGLKQLEKDFLVRDPVVLDDQSLKFVGNLEENSLVYVLHSNSHGLVKAASLAAREFTQVSNKFLAERKLHEPENILVIDCISRALFLGDEFQQELDAIKENLPSGSRMLGLLSLGELKNTDQGAIQFLNKTLVLGGL